MSNKVQRDWSVIRDELNASLRLYDFDYKTLGKAAQIDYYAARRLLKNGASNRTSATSKVCAYFGIALELTAKVQNDKLQELTNLVQEVWDGSDPHADLLAKLIKSTKPFKVQDRTKAAR